MDSLFNYFSSNDYVIATLIIIGIGIVIGAVYAFLVSIKLRASKGFFITLFLMPSVVASVISIMTVMLASLSSNASYVARIATVAVALGLIRFRSTNARSEELLTLFSSVAFGFMCGLGYVLVAAIVAVAFALIYLLLAQLNIFNGKRFSNERLLKITIPESLEYSEVFNETFKHYTKYNELVEVKTTDMGSLFRLSYKVELKDKKEEKEFIDELRTKNGNLEISMLPYVGDDKKL